MHRSVNQANTYQCCPRKYRFRYLDQLPSKPSEYLAIGTAFDDAMTHIIKNGGISESQSKPHPEVIEEALTLMHENALELLNKGDFESDTVADSMNVIFHLSKLIGPYWNKYLPEIGLRPVSTQHRIEYQMDGLEAPLIGFIDMLAEDLKSGRMVIVDFKTTGTREPSLDYKRQVWTYSKAIEQEFSLDQLPQSQLHMFAKAPPTLAKKKREDLGLADLRVCDYPTEIIDTLYDDKTIESKIGIHPVSYDEQEWLAFSEVFFDLEFSLRHGHWPKNRTHYLCNPKFCSYWVPCHSADESLCSLRQKQESLPARHQQPTSQESSGPILDETNEVPFPEVGAAIPLYQQPVETIDDFLFS